jgi:GTP pyrophosphokinase
VVTKLTLLLNIKTHHQLVGLCNYFASKETNKNVLNENTKKIGEEGKELLTRKLKHLKITMSEQVVNELVNFFKLKTSLDLLSRGIGAIENQQLKDYAQKKQ